MGNLRAVLAATLFVAACGKNDAKPDAPIVLIDAAIDARPIDAPPDAPNFDFSCVGMPLPTTADDPVTATGTTEQLSLGGIGAAADVTVKTFRNVTPPVLLNTVTSDVNGAYTTGNLVTGGVPLDAYIEGSKDTLRTTFVFPPQPVSKVQPMVPVLTAAATDFAQLVGFLATNGQDDTTSGALFVLVTDCSNTPVNGATLSVKQGGNAVGDLHDLGALQAQAAGIWLAFDVPDGAVEVNATFGSTTFLAHTVRAFKQNTTDITNGSLTTTIVRPGPLP